MARFYIIPTSPILYYTLFYWQLLMFACLVSGELVQTECTQVSENQFLFSIEKATAIRNLAVFMTGAEPFAEGLGAIVHFSWPPYDNWQVLGYLTNAKPSAIFAVRQLNSTAQAQPSNGFSYQTQWQNTPQSQNSVAQVGVEIADLNSILHQFGDVDSGQAEDNSAHAMDYFCQKMLDSFFNYGESFVREHTDQYSGVIEKVIPAKVFEKWYANFQQKLKANPTFWKD